MVHQRSVECYNPQHVRPCCHSAKSDHRVLSYTAPRKYAEALFARALQRIMTAAPAVLHALLAHLADALAVYVCHQIDSGAQACLDFLHIMRVLGDVKRGTHAIA